MPWQGADPEAYGTCTAFIVAVVGRLRCPTLLKALSRLPEYRGANAPRVVQQQQQLQLLQQLQAEP